MHRIPAKTTQPPIVYEHAIQTACVYWFRLQYPKNIIAAIPNGLRTSFSQARKGQREGVMAGFPDLFIPKPTRLWHGLFIEMKSQNGQVKKHQKEMLRRLQDEGYCVHVCRSLEEFQEAVNRYFGEAA